MTQKATPEPIKFDSPLRERIHRRLGLVGEGPQAFYRDALRLLNSPLVESTTHLVSHLLREIESALRDVLEPIAHYEGRVKAKGMQTHEQEVRFIIGELGLNDTEGPGAAWLEIVEIGLHELAHRRSLERPRPFDEQFRALWADVEVVLDAVLERFESRFVSNDAQFSEWITGGKALNNLGNEFRVVAQNVGVLFENRGRDPRSIRPTRASS